MASERALKAQLDMLRTELEIKKKEAALANMEAARLRQQVSQSTAQARSGSVRTSLGFSQPPSKRFRAESSPRSSSRTAFISRVIPHQSAAPPPAYNAQSVKKAARAEKFRERQAVFQSAGVSVPVAQAFAAGDSALKRLSAIRNRLETGSIDKSLLVAYAGDLMYDVFRRSQPSVAACQELEQLFANFYARIKEDADAGRQEVWAPLAQEVKLFFEAGFRCRKYFRAPPQQMQLFLNYVDILNVFLTLPAEVPPGLSVPAGCWLRPTLAAGSGFTDYIRLQEHIVPDSLVPSDLLVELYWDLEVDLYRKGDDPVDEVIVHRRKKSALKMGLSIMQNCDFQVFRPDETARKAPPVVVVCHSKAMVLKMADTLNYVGRYEYSNGYRGAEAAYRDTEGMSDMPVSVLVCTPGRLLAELKSGNLSLQALKLLVFTLQGGSSPEFLKVQEQAPSTARIMVFLATVSPPKNANTIASQLLRIAPLRLYWEGSSNEPFRVEEFQPSDVALQAAAPAPQVVKSAQKPAKAKKWAQIDFGSPDLNPLIVNVLADHKVKQASEFERLVVPQMMSGEDRIFISPDRLTTALAFVVPTVHLMLNYPPKPRATRVIVLAARIEDVDQVVGEYLRFTTAMPDSGLSAEGLHSQRLTAYETPFNTKASIIAGTTTKVANVLGRREKSLRLDVSTVDVLVLYKLHNKPDIQYAAEVHAAITSVRGSVQVVAFVPSDYARVADDIAASLCPTAVVMPFKA